MKAFYLMMMTVIVVVADEQDVEWFDSTGKVVRVTRERVVEKRAVVSELVKNKPIRWHSRRKFQQSKPRSRGLYYHPYWFGYRNGWPNYFYEESPNLRYSIGGSIYYRKGLKARIIFGL